MSINKKSSSISSLTEIYKIARHKPIEHVLGSSQDVRFENGKVSFVGNDGASLPNHTKHRINFCLILTDNIA
jgi:hypothetical protein